MTGGAGFVGSHLCRSLVDMGYSVTSLDNYSSGRVENHAEGVRYINGDTTSVSEICKFEIDTLFHLGEFSRVENSLQHIEEVIKSNIGGTLSIIKFCKENKIKLVYAGSSTKFGDNGRTVDETPYAWTKARNVDLIKRFGDWYNLQFAITYFYNVYGGRENRVGNYATLIGIFKQQWLMKKPLTIVRPGSQRRFFTHIDDIVKGLVLVAMRGSGDGYGIGNPKKYSVAEVANMFGGDVCYLDERPGNRSDSELFIEKIKSLGWEPTIDLRQHIDEFKKSHGR